MPKKFHKKYISQRRYLPPEIDTEPLSVTDQLTRWRINHARKTNQAPTPVWASSPLDVANEANPSPSTPTTWMWRSTLYSHIAASATPQSPSLVDLCLVSLLQQLDSEHELQYLGVHLKERMLELRANHPQLVLGNQLSRRALRHVLMEDGYASLILVHTRLNASCLLDWLRCTKQELPQIDNVESWEEVYSVDDDIQVIRTALVVLNVAFCTELTRISDWIGDAVVYLDRLRVLDVSATFAQQGEEEDALYVVGTLSQGCGELQHLIAMYACWFMTPYSLVHGVQWTQHWKKLKLISLGVQDKVEWAEMQEYL
jgi:hypothetical protein